jgi:hypothetical protein
MNAMRAMRWALSLVLAIGLAVPAMAQDKPWKDGTVWNVTFVKTKPGMGDIYLRDLAANWRKLMDAAQKEGLIVSYKVLGGSSANRDDWDLMLMTESKNWASFDNSTEKWEALQAKIIGSEDKQQQLMVKRTDVREILGDKTLQEVVFK